MARGRASYLCYTALVLLGHASGTTADDLWSIDIDLSPAPPPELGPPFSANATRNPAYLPYQILGIVGSYFVVVLFIGTLLLSCGQRARKRAQAMAEESKNIEMKRPQKSFFETASPQDKSWYSPDRLKSKKSATASVKSLNSAFSPASESAHSFDADVIEQDRQRRAAEMEQLYAAVMLQDDQRSQARSERSVVMPPTYMAARATDAPNLRHLQDHHTPRSPVRAIYPAEIYHHEKSYSNTSSGSLERPPSFTSAASSKKARRSLKNLKISAPIMRSFDDNSDGARTPLSPRVYIDPGIPPEPPTARTIDTYDESMWPTTPGADYGRPEERASSRDLSATYTQKPKAKKLNFSQPIRVDVPAAPSNNSLPFRQLHWNTPSSPYYPYQGQGPFSAGPTKTTFVEVRRDRLGAPLTGMATPYSAYMPFTPVTPVTPHLTTRAERRQREREQRTLQGAITEEDQVADEKELWGDAY